MILFTHSTVQKIASTEQGQSVYYMEFRNERQEIVHRGLINEAEADLFIQAGAKDLSPNKILKAIEK